MKLYTSYYGNLKNIPQDYFIVSASLNITEELKVAVDSWDTDLAPTKDIFFDYKQNGNWEKYVTKFKVDVLPKIDWLEKLEQWEEKANKINKQIENIVLLCYEKPDDHCHRHILSEQFEKEFKCVVKEFGHENMIRSGYKLIIENNMDILF